MEAGNLIVDTTARIFEDLGSPQHVNLARDDAWRQPLWGALEEMGLTRTWVPDTLNGAGAGVTDGFEVLRVAGMYAVAVPLAETLIAGWALASAGIEVPLGPLAVIAAPPGELTGREGAIAVDERGRLFGRASGVAFGRDADHLAVELQPEGTDASRKVALVAASACRVHPGESLAGDPFDTVELDGVVPLALGEPDARAVGGFTMGAAVRAMLMAGALQSVLDISVEYATERVAFERPIGKFQAVQHNLARLAGEAAAANASANSCAYAIEQAGSYDEGVFIEVASAKIRVGEAAYEGGMIGHQTHGAIGFTREHILHRYTHRLWSWRDEFGDEAHWAAALGARIASGGADGLWPILTRI